MEHRQPNEDTYELLILLQRVERKIDAILAAEKILLLEESEEEPKQVTDVTLSQIQGDFSTMAINGTVLGATSSFTIGFVPATNFVPLQSGPLVSVDDTNVVLTPVDATNSFTATVPATDTGTVYNLTITWVNGAGAPGTHGFAVPILPLPPPPPTQITDVTLTQNS
jgi:hypothetical protein